MPAAATAAAAEQQQTEDTMGCVSAPESGIVFTAALGVCSF
jgi:hypothetical protein